MKRHLNSKHPTALLTGVRDKSSETSASGSTQSTPSADAGAANSGQDSGATASQRQGVFRPKTIMTMST